MPQNLLCYNYSIDSSLFLYYNMYLFVSDIDDSDVVSDLFAAVIKKFISAMPVTEFIAHAQNISTTNHHTPTSPYTYM